MRTLDLLRMATLIVGRRKKAPFAARKPGRRAQGVPASRRRPRRRKSAAQPRLTQWRGGYEVMGRTEARSALWQNTTFTLTVSRSEAMSSIGVQTPEVSEMAYENLKP